MTKEPDLKEPLWHVGGSRSGEITVSTLHISDANARLVGYHNKNAGEYMSEGNSLGRRHGQGTGTWSKAISTPARCRTACSAAETPVRFPMAPSAPAIVRTATQLDGAPIMAL